MFDPYCFKVDRSGFEVDCGLSDYFKCWRIRLESCAMAPEIRQSICYIRLNYLTFISKLSWIACFFRIMQNSSELSLSKMIYVILLFIELGLHAPITVESNFNLIYLLKGY